MKFIRDWLKRRRDAKCAAGYHDWKFSREYDEEYTADWNGYVRGPIPPEKKYMIGRYLHFVECSCSNCGATHRFESYGE